VSARGFSTRANSVSSMKSGCVSLGKAESAGCPVCERARARARSAGLCSSHSFQSSFPRLYPNHASPVSRVMRSFYLLPSHHSSLVMRTTRRHAPIDERPAHTHLPIPQIQIHHISVHTSVEEVSVIPQSYCTVLCCEPCAVRAAPQGGGSVEGR
jgi:hypothetical protein